VVADRDIPQNLADIVLVDNEQGGYLATRYLLDLGHTRIAVIATPLVPSASVDRLRGYKRAMSEAGIAVRNAWIAYSTDSYVGGEQSMAHLLQAQPRPTAIFAYNDVMAIGAYRTLKSAGLRVPEDMSIVGFDDVALASAVVPALTTVAQPIADLATQAMQLLIARIQEGDNYRPGQRVVLDTKLVVRESCAPLLT
jgi:LacI family transcriptional regulator